MTFSIIARCPTPPARSRHRDLLDRRGRTLRRHPAGVGICKTQAYINRGNDLLAMEMLEQGLSPSAVMQCWSRRSRSRVPPDRHHRSRGQCLLPIPDRHAAMGGPSDRRRLHRFRQRAGRPAGHRGHREGFHREAGGRAGIPDPGRPRRRPRRRRPGRQGWPSAGAIGGDLRRRRARLSRISTFGSTFIDGCHRRAATRAGGVQALRSLLSRARARPSTAMTQDEFVATLERRA